MKSLLSLFPNASQSTVAANPQMAGKPTCNIFGDNQLRRGKMNDTEREYALILEEQKRKGEILRYEYEGITLRFAGVKYTPDFVVFPAKLCDGNTHAIKFIEIKGAFIKGKFERAIERFRHARTYWPEFQFELHQKTKQGWKQIE